jgi:hypothetical protein
MRYEIVTEDGEYEKHTIIFGKRMIKDDHDMITIDGVIIKFNDTITRIYKNNKEVK